MVDAFDDLVSCSGLRATYPYASYPVFYSQMNSLPLPASPMAGAARAEGSGVGHLAATLKDEQAQEFLDTVETVGGQLSTLVASGSAFDAGTIAQRRDKLGGLRALLKAAIVEATPGYAMVDLKWSEGKQDGDDRSIAATPVWNDECQDDDEMPFMADIFTAGIDITDEFSYTYGSFGNGAGGLGPITLTLRGVAREFGQTVAVGGTG